MRTLALLAVAALLAGGLAYASTQTTLLRGESPRGAAAEVEPDALLAQAREEVAAYGQGWALVGLGAMETASEGRNHGMAPGAPDPRPGNGLATAWHFQFTGPDGMAFVALKADGQRSGIGWTEQRPHEDLPALPTWAVGSAAAFAKAREDPRVASALDQPGVVVGIHLGVRSTPDEGPQPWWSVHAWAAPPEGSTAHGRTVAFEVHALDGRLVVHPAEGPAGPHGMHAVQPVEPMHSPCCAEERRSTHAGSVDALRPRDTQALDAPAWAGSEGRFVLTWQGSVQGLPKALALSVLGPDLQPLATTSGPSPLRLDAPGLPPGPLYLQVGAAEGEALVSASYEVASVLHVAPPQQQPGWEEAFWFGSGGALLERERTHYLPLAEPTTTLRALLQGYASPGPVPQVYRLSLLDGEGRALATAEGEGMVLLQAGPLAAGEHWLRVEALGPSGLPAGAMPFGGYSVDVRALHPAPVHPDTPCCY